MPVQHRWTLAGLLAAGTLGLVAVAGLAHDTGRLAYRVPPGHAQNQLTLRVSGANIELLDGATGAVLQSRPLAGTQGVTIQGGPGKGDDSLTVDLGGGAMPLPDGIHFAGSAGGYNTLLVTGGEAAPGSYQATGPGEGVVTHAGTRVFFSNLAPVTDTTIATNFTITATAGIEVINIVNGPPCGLGCQTTQVNSPSFESVTFAHKTNVTLNGAAGADTFNLNNSSPATGLSKLVIAAAGNSGDAMSIVNFNLPGGTLSLANAITVTQSGILTVGNLAVHAAGTINLGNFSNHVTTVAGNTTASGAIFNFASSVPTLTVGTVEGIAGITTLNGSVEIQNTNPGGALVVSNAITTAGGGITLFADHMTINAALNAGAGTAYVDNETVSEPIALGTKPANTLGLLQSDLNEITAGTLRIGDFGADTGGLTVTANISATVGWSTLDLRQATNIDEVFSATLTVPDLALQTNGGSVTFQYTFNQVSTLAGVTRGGSFSFRDGGHTTIGTVGGVSGLNSAGGTISVSTNKGGITVDQAVLSGAGSIFLNANESASPVDTITVDPGVVVSSTTSDINLWAADQVNLGSGSVVAAGGAGNVFIIFSLNDIDGVGGGTIAGTVASTNPILREDSADGTLLVDFTAGASLPNGLTYNGGTGLTGLTMSDAGGSSPHQYSASGNGMSRDFASLIHCDRVQVMTVNGGSAADTFFFRPDAGTVFHAIGGPDSRAPGDTLLLALLGVTNPTLSITSFDATGATGQWTFGNRQPVYFTGIDTFGNLTYQLHLPLVRK